MGLGGGKPDRRLLSPVFVFILLPISWVRHFKNSAAFVAAHFKMATSNYHMNDTDKGNIVSKALALGFLLILEAYRL